MSSPYTISLDKDYDHFKIKNKALGVTGALHVDQNQSTYQQWIESDNHDILDSLWHEIKHDKRHIVHSVHTGFKPYRFFDSFMQVKHSLLESARVMCNTPRSPKNTTKEECVFDFINMFRGDKCAFRLRREGIEINGRL